MISPNDIVEIELYAKGDRKRRPIGHVRGRVLRLGGTRVSVELEDGTKTAYPYERVRRVVSKAVAA